MTQYRRPDCRTIVGLAGVLLWLAALVAAEHGHDMIRVRREPAIFWATLYEVSAGYVMGFVAALSASAAIRLDRGPVPEVMAYGRWTRSLAMISLVAVFAIALAGLMMHNMGGATFTYDIAFAVAFILVIKAVLPLLRELLR